MKKILLIIFSSLFIFLSFPLSAFAYSTDDNGNYIIYDIDNPSNCASQFLNLDWENCTGDDVLAVLTAIRSEFGVWSGQSHYMLIKDDKLSTSETNVFYLMTSQDAYRAVDYRKTAADPYITCVRVYSASKFVIMQTSTSCTIIKDNSWENGWQTYYTGYDMTVENVLTGDTWNWVGSYYMKDYIQYIYSTESVDAMGITAGYTAPVFSGDSGGSGDVEEPVDDDKYTGFFGSIIEWLKSIFNNITSIFDSVKENGGLLNTLAEHLQNTYIGLSGWFDELGINITTAIEEAVNAIGNFTEDLLKKMFIPDENYLVDKKNQLEQSFTNLMGFEVSTVSSMFESVDTVEEFKSSGSVSVYGVGAVNFNGVNNQLLLSGINKFKPIIRGFMALMLVFFNMNQLLNLIGQGSITQAIGFVNKQSKGGKE